MQTKQVNKFLVLIAKNAPFAMKTYSIPHLEIQELAQNPFGDCRNLQLEGDPFDAYPII